MEGNSPIPKNWNPRMLHLTWPCSDRETAATLARSVLQLAQAASVRWEGLPLWQTRHHVSAVVTKGTPQVSLLLWPEPDADG